MSSSSSTVLGPDSQKPPEVKGQARLYAAEFSAFSHRIKLILSLKKIPHDIIYITGPNKPEWYLQIQPTGEEPTFVDVDGEVVSNSISIANYLDNKYPDPPLYNSHTKSRDLELINNYSQITNIYSNCVDGKDKRSLDEIVAEISELLVEYENELKARGTTYFGGNQPGMVDVLMWPWVERGNYLPVIYNQPVNFNKQNFPYIMKWIREMKVQEFVVENAFTVK